MKDRKAMDPSVRVAIVGFHKDIEVEYNLYQMSVVGSYRDAMHRLTQEKAKVSKFFLIYSLSTWAPLNFPVKMSVLGLTSSPTTIELCCLCQNW